jgi:hypothetical protein
MAKYQLVPRPVSRFPALIIVPATRRLFLLAVETPAFDMSSSSVPAPRLRIAIW